SSAQRLVAPPDYSRGCFFLFLRHFFVLVSALGESTLQVVGLGNRLMKLRLTARTFAGATIVECSGRLVLGEESAMLRDLVKGALTESKHIVLDLGDVVFIDSAGIGLLARLFSSAQLAG